MPWPGGRRIDFRERLEAKGKSKETAGKVSGKKGLEQKGKLHKTAGKVQAGYGDKKNDIKKGK